MPIQMNMNQDGSFCWPPHVARSVADHIHSEVRDMVANSRLVRKADGVALIERSQLDVGRLLGKGAFSEVHEVRLKGTNQVYAMKHLKFKLMSQPENFRLAAAELAIEAHMLASFDHPHVMQIRGWAANGVASFTQGRHDSFFLLLDRLDETLDQRIQSWQREQTFRESHRASPNMVSDLWRRVSHQEAPSLEMQKQRDADERFEQQMYLEKLRVCSEIASGLTYLHKQGVIFRDLKPNNIGFLNGRVQLFDFGLSRELPGCDLRKPFEMSGKVGTLRYMAVEVACHQPYNVSADVYSWAMVSYEVMTYQKPFSGWTRDMHASLVCGRGVRPETHMLPHATQAMLHSAWSQRAHDRPTMRDVWCQTQLLHQQEQQQHHVKVELPHDFSIVHKTTPSRGTSETAATMSMSMSNESSILLEL